MGRETYLIFMLDNDLFAVNVDNVLEVLEQQQISRVPKAPESILGITNFRGQILPVVNTRFKFNIQSENLSNKNYVIVYEITKNDQRFIVSATADGVKDVIEIDTDEIMPVPEMGLNYDVRFISGVIHQNETYILVIKPDRLFNVEDTEIEKSNLSE